MATARVVDELNAGAQFADSVGSQCSVEGFVDAYPTRYPGWTRTIDTNVERTRGYILPYLPSSGDFPLIDLRRDMLRSVQAELLSRGLSKTTIDGAFAAFSAILRRAVDDDLIDSNPAHGFTVDPRHPALRDATPPRERRFVPPEEVRAFMEAVPPRWRAMCWTPMLTGVRPGEWFALSREGIDRSERMLRVRDSADKQGRIHPGTKNDHHLPRDRQGRRTPLPGGLLSLIDEQPTSLHGPLFATKRGLVWRPDNFRRDVWNPARTATGFDIQPYDLRHTWVSWLIAIGIPLPEISAWAGHRLIPREFRSNTTMAIYAHGTGYWKQRALEALDAFMTAPIAELTQHVTAARALDLSGPTSRTGGVTAQSGWFPAAPHRSLHAPSRRAAARGVNPPFRPQSAAGLRAGKPKRSDLSRRRSRVRVPSLPFPQEPAAVRKGPRFQGLPAQRTVGVGRTRTAGVRSRTPPSANFPPFSPAAGGPSPQLGGIRASPGSGPAGSSAALESRVRRDDHRGPRPQATHGACARGGAAAG